jgi:alkylated DNA repair dioxygenase AlkB
MVEYTTGVKSETRRVENDPVSKYFLSWENPALDSPWSLRTCVRVIASRIYRRGRSNFHTQACADLLIGVGVSRLPIRNRPPYARRLHPLTRTPSESMRTVIFMKNMHTITKTPFPNIAERVVLPNGKPLEDAVIWPGFCQEELGLDPDKLWNELLAFPTWPNDKPIPFRERGDDPHWIDGDHLALHYRGREIKRRKMWVQSGYEKGYRHYGYTGWQHKISYATHAIEFVPPIQRLAKPLNAWFVRSGYVPHNHYIVTCYEDRKDNIGYHSDKDKDFAEDSFFVVIKFGAPRMFAFRVPGADDPFLVRELSAGTAIFVRCKARNAANDLVQHGVPVMDDYVGQSGSIVSRCIETVVPWDQVKRQIKNRADRAASAAMQLAARF